MRNLLSQAEKLIKGHKEYRRRLVVFLCLAVIVACGTLAALRMYGQALTHKVDVLDCQYEVHEHTDDCYAEDEDGNPGTELLCGYADYVVHTHNDLCYGEDGSLVCTLEEHEAHEHTEDCYETQRILVCGKEESAPAGTEADTEASAGAHTHDESCYQDVLTCTLEEHTHDGSCESTELTCGEGEHTHSEGCYDEEGNLICEEEEHTHSDGCYTSRITCGKEEHTHGEGCYERQLVCGLEESSPGAQETAQTTEITGGAAKEAEGHVHTDECYKEVEVLVCGELELHTHDESCYDEDCFDEDGELIEGSLPSCGLLQLEEHTHTEDCIRTVELTAEEIAALNNGAKLHIHDESCYDEEGNLICGYDATHIHGPECYDEEGNLICGYEGAEDHEHDESCYDEEGNLICGYEGAEDHEHDKNCYDIYGGLICGFEDAEDHVHTEDCYDEEGNLICGYELAEEFDNIRIFNGDGYDVIARYDEEANIPEEAILMAEEITPESDQEHYEARETEYRETLEDEEASMRILLRIGFYLEDEEGELEEVEPEAPVTISIQFLDEDGLMEGSPITVVHFADEGTEVLEGGEAVDNSTTFRAGSFSEFAIGYVKGERIEDGTVLISDDFQYDDSGMHITLHIEGEAAVIGKTEDGADTAQEGEPAASADSEEETVASGEEPAAADEEQGEEASASETAQNEWSVASNTDSLMILKVQALGEDEERYQAYADYLESEKEESTSVLFQVMSCRLFYGEEELDLTACEVTIQVSPAESLIESAELAADEETSFLSVVSLSADGTTAEEDVATVVSEEQTSVSLTVASFSARSSETPTAVVFATAVDTKVNPEFEVQFYANLNVPESTSDSNKGLPFINTSETGLGKLPKNGAAAKTEIEKSLIYLDIDEEGAVSFETEPTEIYKAETKEFNPRLGDDLNIDYLNSLRSNDHYNKVALWVLKDEEEETDEKREERATSTIKEYWNIYSLEEGGAEQLAFTNNTALEGKKDENGRTYIVIRENTVLRLVYDPANGNYSSKATFYDYDITDGPKTADSNSTVNTENFGINSYISSDVEDGRFAFGNKNTDTKYGTDLWKGNYLNTSNTETYRGLCFGLVSNPVEDGDGSLDVEFAEDVTGPNIGLFGSEKGIGKNIYGNWNMIFSREGDTFTLSSVSTSDEVTVAKDLEKFKNPGIYDGVQNEKVIWTNNFWPMDKIWENDDTILDPMFGGETRPKLHKWHTGDATLPASDDGLDHNSYFGMVYSVDFNLLEEYVGPLEYYFYGDDDMWVFLDHTLVCDIGGVHSSAGEYVDLWDYVGGTRESHATGKHTLSIFYTERGASGSTCWMQFTVPEISQVYNEPYDPDAASLTIKKEALQFPASEKERGFRFDLKLNVYNEFEVVFKDAEGNKTRKTASFSFGSYGFKLKNGESLEVIGLPIGTQYWVEEKYENDINWDTTITTNVSKGDTEGSSTEEKKKTVASGTILGSVLDDDGVMKDNTDHVTITYTNAYLYSLPKTGGGGTNIYTIAGGMMVLLGAGFLYKKKFRGRRGERVMPS